MWRVAWMGALVIGGGTASAQLSPTDQQCIRAYRSAVASAQAKPSSRSVESAFAALTPVRKALLRVREDHDTVLESLSDSEFVRVQQGLPGTLVNRDEVVFVEADVEFFTRLAATSGKEADRAFFAALKATYPQSVWPVYVEQQTDYGGCTRFGSTSLVETYGKWLEFRGKYPGRYAAQSQTEIDRVIEELTTSTCACGDAAGVRQEWERFRTRFPSSPARSRIDERLEALGTPKSDMRVHCVEH